MEQAEPKHAPNRWKSIAVRWMLIAAILLVGGTLRFTGLNWDEGQWIHPDEGHMRIILSTIRWPDDLSLYFDTHNSPLNARNSGQQYSYGTLPLFLTRAVAEWLDRGCGDSPDRLNAVVGSLLIGSAHASCRPGAFTGAWSAQVGRTLSALADLGTIFLVLLLGRRLYGEAAGFLAAGLYALSAFAIQQAHFITVDSMACFFITLVGYFSVRAGQAGVDRPSWINSALAGLATGLATACKIDGAFAAFIVALAGLCWWLRAIRAERARSPLASLLALVPPLLLAGVLSLVAFRIAQPYAFEGPSFFGVRPSPEWFDRLGQIRREQSGELDYPSGRQWTNRAPILFPWINMVVWGMGLPLGLVAWVGWALAGKELFRGRRVHLALWVWGSLLFLYQSTRWVKAMRYTLPLYPLFAIWAAYGLVRWYRTPSPRRRRLGLGLTGAVVAGAALWALAMFSIYQRPHTRIAASRWFIENVPPGATVATEHWDWGVPLRVDGYDPFGGMYAGFEMQHYNEDDLAKRAMLFDWLDEADYISVSSNRLYASISRLPTRYPLTTAYYRALFAGELGFELLADFTSRPAIGPFQFPDQETPYPLMEAAYSYQRGGIKVPLPVAEEAFSVYDHPRVLIFAKTPAYSRLRVEQILGEIDVRGADHGLKPIEATSRLYILLGDPRLYGGGAAVFLVARVTYKWVKRYRRKKGSTRAPDQSPQDASTAG